MIWLCIGLFLVGYFIGSLIMGLMFASSESDRCRECREKRLVGHWEEIEVPGSKPYIRCSNCKATYFALAPNNYCSRCGAKMEGGNNE